jgi:L-ribulokinase
MAAKPFAALGLDFGTESVRALLVDGHGVELGSAVAGYRHGQIVETLPNSRERLPPLYALQDPQDWLDSSASAVRAAMRRAKLKSGDVVSIGVDFTSCTMLPTLSDGAPLCQLKEFAREPLAWPKLWKHHGAKQQADRMTEVARRRKEAFLQDYGGTIGLEWFFPKVFETLENAPHVYSAAEVWLEAGDWFVWQLVGGPAKELPRSTCQAGYKALWSRESGYASIAFFKAVHPELANVVRDKIPGVLLTPGQSAGGLTEKMVKRLGLAAGIPVSAAVIDAHAGVPGAGAAEPGTLVMVLGTSSCHMINATERRHVPGVCGVVEGGILPGMFGYETGQAAVGDAFDWLRRSVGHRNFDVLNVAARDVEPGADGVRCVDWFNGCRTPLMDGHLRGAFTGLTLQHEPAHLYRALMEASAFGLRWIVDLLRENGVPVKKFVATGGLPHHNPLLVEIYADVLGEPISVHPSKHGPALGAAILGALAAGERTGFLSAAAAVRAMAAPKRGVPGRELLVVRPNRGHRAAYEKSYQEYRALADSFSMSTGN